MHNPLLATIVVRCKAQCVLLNIGIVVGGIIWKRIVCVHHFCVGVSEQRHLDDACCVSVLAHAYHAFSFSKSDYRIIAKPKDCKVIKLVAHKPLI